MSAQMSARLASAFAGAASSRDLALSRRSGSRAPRRVNTAVRAKGKGSKYRNAASDPYQATVKSKEKVAKAAPKPTADRGPINHAFGADEPTEEYFLFARKVKSEAGGSPAPPAETSPEGARVVKSAENEEVAAALGMKPDDAGASAVASLGAWLPLGDISVEAGGDLDTVVAERAAILTSFAKRKHLKLLPILNDEALEFGVRVQRGPPRGPDPTAVSAVARSALAWDPKAFGEFGTVKAELRLMQAMPALGKGKKNEMLTSAMDQIKAQQEKAAAAKKAAEAGEA